MPKEEKLDPLLVSLLAHVVAQMPAEERLNLVRPLIPQTFPDLCRSTPQQKAWAKFAEAVLVVTIPNNLHPDAPMMEQVKPLTEFVAAVADRLVEMMPKG